MRRRWLWFFGIAGLLALALVALAFLLPHAPPFTFLQGREPIFIPEPTASSTSTFQSQKQVFYSFQTDHAALLKRADLELRGKGYSVFMPGLSGVTMYSKPDFSALMSAAMSRAASSPPGKPPEPPEMSAVVIMKDIRLTSGSPPPSFTNGKDKGWVSVEVVEVGEKSIFDRFRDWLGL